MLISPKPIQSQLKLNRIDSRIRDRQSGVGNVFIANAGSKGAALIVEELKAQRAMGYKVYVRRIQRHRVVC